MSLDDEFRIIDSEPSGCVILGNFKIKTVWYFPFVTPICDNSGGLVRGRSLMAIMAWAEPSRGGGRLVDCKG